MLSEVEPSSILGLRAHAAENSALGRFFASLQNDKPVAQRDEFPIDFSVRNFKPGDARRRAAVRPGHAARIEKQNATAPFVARDVRVPVQENIDIIRRMIRRNVLQSEFQPTSRKVENQRPLEIAVAISAHNDHARSNRTAAHQESLPRKHRQDARSHQRLWPSPSRSPADDCACPREQRYARPLWISRPWDILC